MNNFVPI